MKPVRPSVGKKGGGAALGSGGQLPVRVCGGIPPPLIELVDTGGVGTVAPIEVESCRCNGDNNNADYHESFRHEGRLYLPICTFRPIESASENM